MSGTGGRSLTGAARPGPRGGVQMRAAGPPGTQSVAVPRGAACGPGAAVGMDVPR